MKDRIRYSEAFKLKVMEELRDAKWKSVWEAAKAYGIAEMSVYNWMRKLGFEHLKGRFIYVKTRTELDRIKELEEQVLRLKQSLADEVLDHKIDVEFLKIACKRAGTTVDDLKKEWWGVAHWLHEEGKVPVKRVCSRCGRSTVVYYKDRKARARLANKEDFILLLARRERIVNPMAGCEKVLYAIRPAMAEEGVTMGVNRFYRLMKKNGMMVPKRKLDVADNSYTVAAYLIAQFGKNFNAGNKAIRGDALLSCAMNHIRRAQDEIGGQVVFLEMEHGNHKLAKFYSRCGFLPFGTRTSDEKGGRVVYDQMFMFLK